MAVTKIKPIKSTLSKALDYIENPDKTDGKMLVSSFGCSYETADIEFEYTLSQALQKGNNLAFHLIQSFEPGEVDYQKAHEIGKQLADAVTKGQHEYVLTTHIDKGHVHNHIIFCAVNFVDHRKYNSNKRSYYGIRNMSDKLCRENGLSVVVPGKGSKGKSYAEYQAEKTGTSWKGKLKIAVDALIPQVSSFEELLTRLQAAGYEIKPGKYVSCRAPGQERFTRLKTLGADYTEEAIRERIAGRRAKAAKAPREQRDVSLLKVGEMIYHAPEDRYDCSNNIRGRQRYEKLCCSHSITTKALETLVLETIKRTCDYAVENEAEFREKVCSISEEQQGELSVRLEKRLAQKQKRVSEINRLIKKLYEDNISGKLNDKRFNTMLSDYESELEALEEDIERDNAELEGMCAKKTDVDVFMELVKKHMAFDELTPAILNEFVDKIMVYKAVGSGANRMQDVDIYLNYIGRFVVPEVVVELTEEEKLAEAKRQEKLEKKRASNRKYMARKREEARKAWAEIEAEKAKVVGH